MRDINNDLAYVESLLRNLYGDKVPKINEVKISKRMTSTFGRCTTHRYDDGWTKLTFASFILDERFPYEEYMSVLVHEYTHAIDRNKHGHTGEWLRMAEEISDCYIFFNNIQRYVHEQGVESRNEIKPPKVYKCVCKECGAVFKRTAHRAPKWYAHSENFHCKCGGRLKKII